jgi:hypothetical protein
MADDTLVLITFVIVVLMALGTFAFWFMAWSVMREAHEYFSRENTLYRMRLEDDDEL